ncbi:TetR/AcrR family transcriptional regulator [Neorhizobium sp. JUb45]|uniref:TetR/AcrR family transcriptional regulator n=1 Tax=Neorhizobium sp. JUb45 TaxID=2485113 RepID=UPI001FDEC66F|nr:TetR/AcrR family transcriptional regulator [Neorhizobium sp. JUb45]
MTIDRIIDAADQTFRHFGYSKTTVADIADSLGTSSANIYRFFPTKRHIHQALCARILDSCYNIAHDARHSPASATVRLRTYLKDHHRWTNDVLLDDANVHEIIVVAIEHDWNVIERHVESVQALICEIITEGIRDGEFAEQDPVSATRCFSAATMNLCHPQIVAQCRDKRASASVDELAEFAIRALKK